MLQTFSDTEPFAEEAMDHTRKQWATFLLECKKDNTAEDECQS